MREVEKLLDADQENTRMSLELLKEFDPALLDCFEAGAELYLKAAQSLAIEKKISHSPEAVKRWAAKHDLSPQDAFDQLADAHLVGALDDEETALKTGIAEAKALRAQLFLILRLQRDFMFGLTDLMRLRISPGLGYLRLQLETLALIKIMEVEPAAGELWLDTFDDDGGRAFHKRYQRPITDNLRQWDLYDVYSQISGTSQHSRVSSLAAGILKALADEPGKLGLVYQEIDAPEVLLVWFGSFLDNNQKIARRLLEALPAIASAAEPTEALQRYRGLLAPILPKIHSAHRQYRQAK